MRPTEYFGRTPTAFQAAASLFRLLGASENPVAFIRHARNGDIEGAFNTIDRPNDDLHREVAAIRKLALDVDPVDDGERGA